MVSALLNVFCAFLGAYSGAIFAAVLNTIDKKTRLEVYLKVIGDEMKEAERLMKQIEDEWLGMPNNSVRGIVPYYSLPAVDLDQRWVVIIDCYPGNKDTAYKIMTSVNKSYFEYGLINSVLKNCMAAVLAGNAARAVEMMGHAVSLARAERANTAARRVELETLKGHLQKAV